MCRIVGAADDVRYRSYHHTSDQALWMVDVAAAFDITTTRKQHLPPKTDDDGVVDQPSGADIDDRDLVFHDDDDVDCLSA